PGQRNHLNVERLRRQSVGDRKAVVAAAVIHIDDFARKAALLPQLPRDLRKLGMKARQAGALVKQRYDDGQADLGLRTAAIRAGGGCGHSHVARIYAGQLIAQTTGSVAAPAAEVCALPPRGKRLSGAPMALRSLTDRLVAAWHARAITLKAMSFAAVGVMNS